MEQRSPEWYAARLGKVTASRTADVLARTKTGYGASRANYMAELLCERLTNSAAERFSNAAMQWGTDQEPNARALYELTRKVDIQEVGFADHPTIVSFGASPDGLVGEDGLIEIKCPNTAKHIDTLLKDTIDGDYITQMHVQMMCTGRKWCDFVSYDPRMPPDMQLYVRRVHLDPALVREIEIEVQKFLDELAGKIIALTKKFSISEEAA